MVQQLLDDLLHLRTKHTNMMIPFNQYIGPDKFPKQAKDIGEIVTLRYRDNSEIDYEENTLIGADKYDPHNVFEGKFIIVRHDIEGNYRVIAMAEDYSKILVNNNYKRFSDDITEYVYRYPLQCTNLIGLQVDNQYPGIDDTITATILRADLTEPTFCVLSENLGTEIRFLLGDECMSKIGDRDPDNYQIPKLTELGREKIEREREVAKIIRKTVEGKNLWS